MSGSAGQQSIASNMLTGFRLDKGSYISWLIVLAALAGTMTQVDGDGSILSALLRSVSTNKVLWLCLGIAIWHMQHIASAPLGWLDLFAAIPAVACSLLMPGPLAWVGLLISLLLLSKLADFGVGRAGMWIAVASCCQVLATYFLSQLGGDVILKFEAQLVGLLAQPFVSELTVQGSALLGREGHTLVLVWGCSAFSNLGFSLLLFWALVTLRCSEKSISKQKGLVAGYLLSASVVLISINLFRLSLMASGPEFFEYLHFGSGASLTRVFALGCIAMLGLTVPLYEKSS